MIKLRASLHSFFLAATFVLVGYNELRPGATGYQLWVCLAGALVVVAVVYYLLRLLIGRPYKAGIITTVCLVYFCLAREMRLALEKLLLWIPHAQFLGRIQYLVAILILSAVMLVWLVLRTHRDLTGLRSYLNAASGLIAVATIAQVWLSSVKPLDVAKADPHEAAKQLTAPPSPPDIYYIVSDSHTSAESLKEYWGYDESALIRFLESHGFHVVRGARTNSTFTPASIATALTMRLVQRGGERSGAGEVAQLFGIIKNAHVPAQLRKAGYVIVNLSFFEILDQPRHYQYPFLDATTLPRLLLEKSAWHYYYVVWGQRRLAATNLEIVDSIAKLAARPAGKPRFVYAHLMMPHAPFLFDREGRRVVKGLGRQQSKGDYLEQLIYTDRLLMGVVFEILSRSKRPPIIILQGDHGFRHGSEGVPAEEASTILNAYHLPGSTPEWVYEGITPVNSFRLVFNRYFGTLYSYAPDRPASSGFGQGDATDH
jgi:hypothetical protein